MIAINAPYRLDAELAVMTPTLAKIFAREDRGAIRLDRLSVAVSDKFARPFSPRRCWFTLWKAGFDVPPPGLGGRRSD